MSYCSHGAEMPEPSPQDDMYLVPQHGKLSYKDITMGLTHTVSGS